MILGCDIFKTLPSRRYIFKIIENVKLGYPWREVEIFLKKCCDVEDTSQHLILNKINKDVGFQKGKIMKFSKIEFCHGKHVANEF